MRSLQIPHFAGGVAGGASGGGPSTCGSSSLESCDFMPFAMSFCFAIFLSYSLYLYQKKPPTELHITKIMKKHMMRSHGAFLAISSVVPGHPVLFTASSIDLPPRLSS